MAIPANRQSYYPPISPSPTPAEIALHLKNIYTFGNDHDQAIDLLNGKVESNKASSATAGVTTIVTKTWPLKFSYSE